MLILNNSDIGHQGTVPTLTDNISNDISQILRAGVKNPITHPAEKVNMSPNATHIAVSDADYDNNSNSHGEIYGLNGIRTSNDGKWNGTKKQQKSRDIDARTEHEFMHTVAKPDKTLVRKLDISANRAGNVDRIDFYSNNENRPEAGDSYVVKDKGGNIVKQGNLGRNIVGLIGNILEAVLLPQTANAAPPYVYDDKRVIDNKEHHDAIVSDPNAIRAAIPGLGIYDHNQVRTNIWAYIDSTEDSSGLSLEKVANKFYGTNYSDRGRDDLDFATITCLLANAGLKNPTSPEINKLRKLKIYNEKPDDNDPAGIYIKRDEDGNVAGYYLHGDLLDLKLSEKARRRAEKRIGTDGRIYALPGDKFQLFTNGYDLDRKVEEAEEVEDALNRPPEIQVKDLSRDWGEDKGPQLGYVKATDPDGDLESATVSAAGSSSEDLVANSIIPGDIVKTDSFKYVIPIAINEAGISALKQELGKDGEHDLYVWVNVDDAAGNKAERKLMAINFTDSGYEAVPVELPVELPVVGTKPLLLENRFDIGGKLKQISMDNNNELSASGLLLNGQYVIPFSRNLDNGNVGVYLVLGMNYEHILNNELRGNGKTVQDISGRELHGLANIGINNISWLDASAGLALNNLYQRVLFSDEQHLAGRQDPEQRDFDAGLNALVALRTEDGKYRLGISGYKSLFGFDKQSGADGVASKNPRKVSKLGAIAEWRPINNPHDLELMLGLHGTKTDVSGNGGLDQENWEYGAAIELLKHNLFGKGHGAGLKLEGNLVDVMGNNGTNIKATLVYLLPGPDRAK